MMRLLERIATRFAEVDIPLLVLKGAALNLALYEHPDERPMVDLDLFIEEQLLPEAIAALEEPRLPAKPRAPQGRLFPTVLLRN